MKLFKYLLIFIGSLMGLFLAFLEFGPMDSLDDNFEPVVNLNYDIVIDIIFPYGTIYVLIGAVCGFSLWLILFCFISVIKILKKKSINS